MNTKPMIFTTENIRGIRDGRKTMTRRVIKPQPSEGGLEWCTAADGAFSAWQDPLLLLDEHSEDGGPCQRVCPYGVPGDLLWVRETWGKEPDRRTSPSLGETTNLFEGDVFYRASHENNYPGPWKPSIHMPRTLSRLTLRVSNVRVERVQDISEEDMIAEGITDIGDGCGCLERANGNMAYSTTRNLFMQLWDSINAKRGYSWESNPYVWIIEWDKVWEKNIDEVIKELAA